MYVYVCVCVYVCVFVCFCCARQTCEDIGRQMLTYGRRMHPLEALKRIEAVDQAAIFRVARRFFWDKDFALAAVGNTHELPDYNWLRRRTYAARF